MKMPTPTPLPQPRRDRDESPLSGLRALADVKPPPSLVAGVMRQLAEPQPVSFWSWLRRPRRIELRLSPLTCAAMSLVLITGGYALSRRAVMPTHPIAITLPQAPASSGAVAVADDGTVLVRFVLVAKGAKKVAVAGDFNGWSPDGAVLQNANGEGLFVATIQLPRGAHEYMFVVDGEWVTDPAAPEQRPDGFGRSNGVLRL